MTHSRASFLIDAYDRSELSLSDRDALDVHLNVCTQCSDQAAAAAGLKEFCTMAAESPAGFDAALEAVRQSTMRSIRLAPQRSFDPMRWIRALGPLPLALPAAAAAILLLVVLVRPGGPAAPPSSEVAVLVTPLAIPEVQEPSVEANLGPAPAQSALPSTAKSHRTLPQPQAMQVQGAFLVVRSEAEIRIEWSESSHAHRIRKSFDASSAQVAGGQVVKGGVWSDPETHLTPGTVTFYLVD